VDLVQAREVEDKQFKAKVEAGLVPADSHKRAEATHGGEETEEEATTQR